MRLTVPISQVLGPQPPTARSMSVLESNRTASPSRRSFEVLLLRDFLCIREF